MCWSDREQGLSFIFLDTGSTASPVEIIETFDSSRPSLSPGDSISLPMCKVAGYVDVVKSFWGLDYMGSHDHADIGCQVYSSMNTLPRASSHKHHTKRRRRCTSRPRPTSSAHLYALSWSPLRRCGPSGEATTRATEKDGATFWTNVVSVIGVRVSDRTLFRVLMWGVIDVE